MSSLVYPHLMLSNIKYATQVDVLRRVDEKQPECSVLQVYAKKNKGDSFEDLGEMKVSHRHLTFLDRQRISYSYFVSEGKSIEINETNLDQFVRL